MIFLVEIWLQITDDLYLKDFDIMRYDKMGRRGGGTAILVKKYIEYSYVEDIDNSNGLIDYTGVLVRTNRGGGGY